MSDLRDLYQEVILDHNRRPRNFGELPDADRVAEGVNRLCGDQLTLYLKLDGDVIADIAFEGVGCAISTASASVMTEVVKGKTIQEAQHLRAEVIDMLTGDPTVKARPPADLGKLAVFAGVREYPARVKCATMAWHTLEAALEGRGEVAMEE
jgi:nitrogen fixation protein NifU and related proteins